MNIFTAVQAGRVPRSRFNLDHTVNMSLKMGKVFPTMWEEVQPGDSFTLGSVSMFRLAPLVSPVMHRIRISTRYFFVPNRIMWPEWQKYMARNTEAAHPVINLPPQNKERSLANYLGIPVAEFAEVPPGSIKLSAFPFAAYRLIWQEYYRSQQLQDEVFEPLVAGDNYFNYVTDFHQNSCLPVGWRHDYLTSALPDAQFGDPVAIPLTFQNGIEVYLEQNGSTAAQNVMFFRDANGAPSGPSPDVTSAAGPAPLGNSMHVGGNPAALDPNGTLKVDVNSHAANITDLRLAFRLQEWQEMLARGGTRYTEVLKMHFGVSSSDSRMQRPEYLGGYVQNMVISEVLSTAQSSNNPEDADVPVGHMAGHGISADAGQSFRFRAEEHGVLMCLVSIMPDPSYMDGIPRQFFRNDQLDYAWPKFALIGEQGIYNAEVFVNSADPMGIWAYAPRYAEYKHKQNRVAGDFSANLTFWHMARKFSALPPLNAEFIAGDPTNRIFAVTDGEEDNIYAHIQHKVSASRPLPRFGVPTI